LAVGGILLYAALLFLLYVSPKRSEASRLGDEIVAAELRLADAQLAARGRSGAGGAPVSDVLRLSKAMPSSTDQPGLVLELTRLAARSRVALRSVSSEPPVSGAGGATMIPVVVIVAGSYRQITTFLNRTRSLVAVRHGRLRAKGRLFAVQSVELVESVDAGFPRLDGTVTLNAYVYDGPIVPATPPSSGDQSEVPAGTSAAGGAD
jgi:hypothetical protein